MDYPVQPQDAVRFIPTNRQEHDNQMRALVGAHMGGDFSNPSQWVVDAVHEAFQRGFAMGLAVPRLVTPIPEEALPPGMRKPAPEVLEVRRIERRQDDVDG